MGIKRERKIHRVWEEWKDMPQHKDSDEIFKYPFINKWQYIYTMKGSSKRVSLISFNPKNKLTALYKNAPWEVYDSGDDDVRRFRTRKQAEEYVEKLFQNTIDSK